MTRVRARSIAARECGVARRSHRVVRVIRIHSSVSFPHAVGRRVRSVAASDAVARTTRRRRGDATARGDRPASTRQCGAMGRRGEDASTSASTSTSARASASARVANARANANRRRRGLSSGDDATDGDGEGARRRARRAVTPMRARVTRAIATIGERLGATTTTTTKAEKTRTPPRRVVYDDDGNVLSDFVGQTTCAIESDDESGMTRVKLTTYDRVGLMADLGNAFNSMALSIRSAHLTSTNEGLVECTFVASTFALRAMAANDYEELKTRLVTSALRRGKSPKWIERQARLKQLFKRIDTLDSGYISQREVDTYAKSLKMPASFVHDFVAEGDSNGNGWMNFEEFAAYARSKDIALRDAFDSLEPDDKGVITGKQLKSGLRDLELRSGRYNTRKKLRQKNLDAVLQSVSDNALLDADDFRDLLVFMPVDAFRTVQPYYMKVGLDIGPRRLAIPDKRKDGSPWGHFVAGGVAGVVAKTMSSPLNVVAIRTTVGGDGTVGLVQMFQKIMREEGTKGFFKGNLANSLSSAPGKAFDFFAYSTYKNLLTRGEPREPTNVERLLAGSLAGMTSDTLLYPLEVISTRLSINTKAYANSLAAAAAVVRQTGLRGLYSGWGSAMLGTIPYTGLSFGTYDILSSAYKRATKQESAGALPTLLCGVTSGFIASTASYPIYRVTVRMQTGLAPSSSIANCLKLTLKEGGAKALFRGWVPSSLKIVPQAGFSFLTYELVRTLLKEKEEKDRAAASAAKQSPGKC